MKKQIFVLYTGGTIGMRQGSGGLVPDTALAATALKPFSDGIGFHWHICDPLIDSSAVTPADWLRWLDIIRRHASGCDGVLVLHGTDTLAYTANFLALALRGFGKPVILTGAQWPYDAQGSDAPHNLATAVAAFQTGFRQVAVAFDGKLLPAVGSSKVSTETADGFANPHFGALASWSAASGWYGWQMPSEKGGETPPLRLDADARVVCLTLIPGFSAAFVAQSLRTMPAQAVVLQSYGHGNAPCDADFIEAVRGFTGRGGLVLNISQVPQGCARAVYAQGSALRGAGVVNGGRCNLETASVLLAFAVSEGWSAARLEQELGVLKLL